MAVQEFDFSTGKVLDPNRRQAIILANDAADAEVLAEALRTKHYKLAGKADGIRQALELVKKHKVGILFLDADTEGVKAVEVAGSIRRAFPDFNVVLMTANATRELLAEVQQVGAAGFLLKPLTAEAIVNVLSRIK